MVITLLRVSVAAWSATPVRALYHLCLSLNLTRVNQSPSPFFMENGNDSRLIWALKNCCNASENGKKTQGGNSSVDYSASLEGQSNERGPVLRQLATWLLQVQ